MYVTNKQLKFISPFGKKQLPLLWCEVDGSKFPPVPEDLHIPVPKDDELHTLLSKR